jgi:hypothetical protein
MLPLSTHLFSHWTIPLTYEVGKGRTEDNKNICQKSRFLKKRTDSVGQLDRNETLNG